MSNQLLEIGLLASDSDTCNKSCEIKSASSTENKMESNLPSWWKKIRAVQVLEKKI
ncbi:hypothetical protein [Desulfuribacillus stibiiarsenatis]|uniref:hypothetical protein n=1 Tax=Desulfuribacillus stibiiarsenatis TaxID=1390249 RepID=UPI0015B5684D|nr:hypothetical protein [Desulfuribacillus stibiiarsenatis]